MTEPTNVEKIVMRRVRRARVLRVLFSNTTLASVVAVAALWDIGREVWVSKVLTNGPHDLLGHGEYLAYAFEHAHHLSVQILSVLALVAFIVLARETARMLVAAVTPMRTA